MIRRVAQIVINKCLKISPGESLLIVCDDKLTGIAEVCYKVAKEKNIAVVLLKMRQRRLHGEEPPREIASALKVADAAILLTSMSLSHTKARKEASAKFGTRIVSLPGITPEIFKRSIDLDYSILKKRVDVIAKRLTLSKHLEIYTDSGTHLTMSTKNRRGFSDNGVYTTFGAFGNLPAGEACISPCEGTTEGTLVIDASAPLVGKLKHPIKIKIKRGLAQGIPLPKIAKLIKPLGKRALNIAELGIGLNRKAKVTGNILEDEKSYGTAHLAIGANISFGGNVSCPCHLDFVFFNPTIIIDGKRLKI